jgi:hypothetical protein
MSASSLSEDVEKRSAEDPKPDVGFVACIERGELERQALLLFESIRSYTGRFRDCAIYALSPRAGHGISENSLRKLDELGVNYIDTVLNTECLEYGPANRVAAGAYIEDNYPHEILVTLDSDTVFLREPNRILLPPDVDVAVRPEAFKGMGTDGPTDPFDSYWRDLCRCCGVDYEQIPWTESFADRRRIKANYNAGLVVVRGKLGIMQRCADFFFASVRQRLVPHPQDRGIRSGAGWVNPGVGRMWGSEQAALSLAIWSSTRQVQELEPTYNYSLIVHDQVEQDLRDRIFPHLVHLHYHWMLQEETWKKLLFDESGPLSAEQRTWLSQDYEENRWRFLTRRTGRQIGQTMKN